MSTNLEMTIWLFCTVSIIFMGVVGGTAFRVSELVAMEIKRRKEADASKAPTAAL